MQWTMPSSSVTSSATKHLIRRKRQGRLEEILGEAPSYHVFRKELSVGKGRGMDILLSPTSV